MGASKIDIIIDHMYFIHCAVLSVFGFWAFLKMCPSITSCMSCDCDDFYQRVIYKEEERRNKNTTLCGKDVKC